MIRLLILACSFLFFCSISFGFDSPSRVLLDATIDQGTLVTTAGDLATQRSEVIAQLRFVEGQLERQQATPDLDHGVSVQTFDRASLSEGRLQIGYRATFSVAWVKSREIPTEFDLILPEGGNADSLAKFEKRYRSECSDSLGEPFEVTFWYQFDPLRCSLGGASKPEFAMRVPMHLAVSPQNTTNKSPAYDKIWEDGKLVVSYIAGNEESYGPARDLVGYLEQEYGQTTDSHTESGSIYTIHNAEFTTPSGKLVLHGVDMDEKNVQALDQAFTDRFHAFLKDSDLVAYNGHAGLGKNVQAFTKLAAFASNHYYLYWINACKPFAYIDDSLFNAISAADPGAPASRYLNIMATTGVGTFADAGDLMSIIRSLVGRKDTFRQLLDRLDVGSGDPSVMGENGD